MRWTVRGVADELVQKVQACAQDQERTLGACLNEALTAWLSNQPESVKQRSTWDMIDELQRLMTATRP